MHVKMSISSEETGKTKFYVLVPVYKVEKYIHACIDSVVGQTYQNFRLIIVDDGSPDSCGMICDDYASQDNRITVIHQSNMGQISARQTAIREVKRQMACEKEDNLYIVFLDSDDSLKPEALAKINQCIQIYGCDMVVYGMDLVADGKIVTAHRPDMEGSQCLTDKRLLYRKVFTDAGYNSLCRKAISTKLLSDEDYSAFYHISLAEDLLQSIAYYKNCASVYFLEESLYNYTVNLNSMTHSISSDNFRVDFTVRQMVMDFLISENVFTEDDWKQYLSYCISILCNVIETILKFSVSEKKKRNWFEEIWNSEYYKDYIRGKDYEESRLGWRNYLYRMFQRKSCWSVLLATSKLFQLISNIRK